MRNLCFLKCIDGRTCVAASDVEKAERFGNVLNQKIAQSLIYLAVEEIVIVHQLAIDSPLPLKKGRGRIFRGARQCLASIDALIDHVLTVIRNCFSISRSFVHTLESEAASNSASLSGQGVEVNDEARGGRRQTFA